MEAVEQIGQLGLAFGGEQQVVEGPEAPALVGFGDAAAVGEQVVEQVSLGAFPHGDLFAETAIEVTEVLLDLTEVGEEFAGGAAELLVAVSLGNRIGKNDVAGCNALDLGIDDSTAALQVSEPRRRVLIGTEHHLPEQLEDGRQPRLGTDEGASSEVANPGQRLLDRRREVVVWLVGVGQVETPKPAPLGPGPFVEILLGRPREPGRAIVISQALVECVQLVVQLVDERVGRHVAGVRVDEDTAEEAEHQCSVARRKQRPRRVTVPQLLDLVVVHHPPLPTKAARRNPGVVRLGHFSCSQAYAPPLTARNTAGERLGTTLWSRVACGDSQ